MIEGITGNSPNQSQYAMNMNAPYQIQSGMLLHNVNHLHESNISDIIPEPCAVCEGRRYVDNSTDGSVSFQAPTHISPEASFSKVAAHEGEHLTNDRASAEARGMRVVSQTVTFHMDRCSGCGKIFKAGGKAETIAVRDMEENDPRLKPERGEYLDYSL